MKLKVAFPALVLSAVAATALVSSAASASVKHPQPKPVTHTYTYTCVRQATCTLNATFPETGSYKVTITATGKSDFSGGFQAYCVAAGRPGPMGSAHFGPVRTWTDSSKPSDNVTTDICHVYAGTTGPGAVTETLTTVS